MGWPQVRVRMCEYGVAMVDFDDDEILNSAGGHKQMFPTASLNCHGLPSSAPPVSRVVRASFLFTGK